MNQAAFNATLTTMQQAGTIAANVNLTNLSALLSPLIIDAEQTAAQNAKDLTWNNQVAWMTQGGVSGGYQGDPLPGAPK